GGGNAVNRMVTSGLTGIEFIAMNTDVQVLRSSLASVRVQLGKDTLKGLGAGGDPEKARLAALESSDRIKEVVTGADMIFITAGMGGGTGTGSAPVVAEIAKAMDILTVGVVTTPFEYELQLRNQQAKQGIAELKKHLDTLITIPNDKVFVVIDERTHLEHAFAIIDDVLRQAVQAVSEIIIKPGLINRDFNDLKRILKNAGEALIGMGEAKGEDRARIAARKAMENPLLENVSITGAKKILVNISAAKGLTLGEVREVMDLVKDAVSQGALGADTDIAYGAVEDEKMEDRMKVTVVASGLPPAGKGRKISSEPKRSETIGKFSEKECANIEVPAYLNWDKKYK
ncbi:MAG: cell division protein FtsZ, partial [Endomicrobiia bacterium]|nr:cell division protein FtsZ [Endomicrobiia bacterium]